jgi:hypothetical protein
MRTAEQDVEDVTHRAFDIGFGLRRSAAAVQKNLVVPSNRAILLISFINNGVIRFVRKSLWTHKKLIDIAGEVLLGLSVGNLQDVTYVLVSDTDGHGNSRDRGY